MSDPAIAVENLGKLYRIGLAEQRHESIVGAVASTLAAPLRNFRRLRGLDTYRENGDGDDLVWALRDVSFEVGRGEVLGIIGRNGAGKSTLLKILSRITEPTKGRISIEGRVSSLLEVGTGFHPELTGRENVYLNGTILGMSKREIDRKFDEIVAFSGVERFLDTAVKRYSSGMKVRLAFAVAAHLEPEILIVDEVLAVGDFAFQKKCLGKMQDVSTQQGRTVLFVSHNMQAISTLTNRCLVLESGRTIFCGDTEDGIGLYHESNSEQIYLDSPSPDEPRVTRVELATTEPGNVHRNGEPFTINLDIYTPFAIKEARLAIQIRDTYGRNLVHLATFDRDQPMCREPGLHHLTCQVPRLRLYMGQYSLTVQFRQALNMPAIQVLEGICPFEVVMYGRERAYPWYKNMCAYIEDSEWKIS